MSEIRKVLSEGDGWCVNLNQGHEYKPAGKHYAKVQATVRAESERYLTLFCERCGESIEVVYSEDFSNEQVP